MEACKQRVLTNWMASDVINRWNSVKMDRVVFKKVMPNVLIGEILHNSWASC